MNTQLYKLIGQETIYQDDSYILIEIIDDGPFLVFQCSAINGRGKKEIQRDQHGNAKRKSLPTFTISCLNEFKTDLHPTLKEMLPPEAQASLLQALIISHSN